jgi:hypothetical protein
MKYTAREFHLLIGLASGDLACQVLLLIVKVLELKVQSIDFLASFGRGLLSLPHAETSVSVLTTKLGE